MALSWSEKLLLAGAVLVGVLIGILCILLVIGFFLLLGMIFLWGLNQLGLFLPWTWDKVFGCSAILGVLWSIFGGK